MPPTTPELRIHVLLREEEIARDFAAALEHEFLDEKFFYWLPNSAQAWIDLCSSTAYRNADRALGLLQRESATLSQLARGVERLCGIGCGDGSKDAVLLKAFQLPPAYIAADFSQTLLEISLLRCAPLARSTVGVKLDVFRDTHLSYLTKAGSPIAAVPGNSMYAVLGNTLGAFDPAQFPARLRRVIQPSDWALFDGEIFAGEETLRGYDNPENRRFAFAPLAALGLEDGRDGTLCFQQRAGQDGLHHVTKFFDASRSIEFNIGGRRIQMATGDRLRMSSSIKYEEATFRRLLEAGGFTIRHFARSDDQRFILAAVQPA
jgi:uncharacterized SAM-dependent methyltransferase